eukprot:2052467-Alexandrium_andersonii.AAC.1
MCIRDRCLPTCRSGASAIQAAPELSAHPRPGHLWRGGDLRILVDVGTQMRLTRVNEESFTGPAPAAVDAAPPSGR